MQGKFCNSPNLIMKKDIIDILAIEKNDIISITGSGGKTSLMFKLAQKLKNKGKVLVTTSTKIRVPKDSEADFIYRNPFDYKKSYSNSITVIGDIIKEKNKLQAIDKDVLTEIRKDFDYTLIEADGSRNLALKFWKDYEPVVYKESSKTVGIIPIKVLGKKADPSFIYNYNSFIENIKDEVIGKETILKLIMSKPGIFGDFKGKRIIYINQVENNKEVSKAKDLALYLKENLKDIEVFYGSLIKEEYYEN